ncbi:uncharacterized protein C12orf40 homolog isoform X3 [Oryzias latipes]|uniref:uncharacterized protein C12orf40 homolog isoform X3 n=1 Tax=Oryzias latipes TaxID=8090 RepID=UPI0009D9872F|nr:uncharacterized protein C12orf40 homolog isoform X3 [Oryzias latipes]
MNWVGGSRNRLVMKNNAKKQREFFEKKKMEQKLKKLGINLPNSSSGNVGSGSTDLMTLLIVNQIATKKANQDPPKVTVFGSSKKSLKHRRNEALVLPMSPGSPSKLFLADSQPHYSFQGMQTRKTLNHQGFKCGQLSPVLESAFSDNSASDYLPPRTDLPSPSSSASSLSSGRGIFQFQMNPEKESHSQAQVIVQRSPLPWDDMQQSRQFQPFSQPRSMTEACCWSNTSEPPLFQIQTSSPAQGFFGSPEPDRSEGEVCRMNTDIFPTQPEDEGLDFTLSQEDPEHATHQDVFKRFCQDENGREGSGCGGPQSKLFLAEETSIRPSGLQTVPDCQSMLAEVSMTLSLCRRLVIDPHSCVAESMSSFLNESCCCLCCFPSQFYKNADFHSSSPGPTPRPVSGCEYSPSCSCTAGYYSSDSNDDEPCCEPVSSSCTAHACYPIHLDQALLSPKPPQSRPPTPSESSNTSLKDEENILKTSKAQMMETTSPAVRLSLEQSPEFKPCGCRKARTQDAAAQTLSLCKPDARDATTQCGPDVKAATPPFSLHPPDGEGVSGRRSHAEPQEAPIPTDRQEAASSAGLEVQRATVSSGDSLRYQPGL